MLYTYGYGIALWLDACSRLIYPLIQSIGDEIAIKDSSSFFSFECFTSIYIDRGGIGGDVIKYTLECAIRIPHIPLPIQSDGLRDCTTSFIGYINDHITSECSHIKDRSDYFFSPRILGDKEYHS